VIFSYFDGKDEIFVTAGNADVPDKIKDNPTFQLHLKAENILITDAGTPKAASSSKKATAKTEIK
jgi:hypothetical protein